MSACFVSRNGERRELFPTLGRVAELTDGEVGDQRPDPMRPGGEGSAARSHFEQHPLTDCLHPSRGLGDAGRVVVARIAFHPGRRLFRLDSPVIQTEMRCGSVPLRLERLVARSCTHADVGEHQQRVDVLGEPFDQTVDPGQRRAALKITRSSPVPS